MVYGFKMMDSFRLLVLSIWFGVLSLIDQFLQPVGCVHSYVKYVREKVGSNCA